MKLKVIACRVFEPEMDVILKSTVIGDADISVDWLPLRAHDQPEILRGDLQALIDAASDFDAVILAYGLCGNASAGLRAGTAPLFIPRAHDCSQILLGGLSAHNKRFADNPSRGWTSRGYMAEDNDPFRVGETVSGRDMKSLVDQYGEENARYVWDTLHASDSCDDPVLYFLDVPETGDPVILEGARRKAEERGKRLEVIPATLSLLICLMGGRGGDEILHVPPGAVIKPTWDDNVIMSETESL